MQYIQIILIVLFILFAIYILFPKKYLKLYNIHKHYPQQYYVSIDTAKYPKEYSTTYGEIEYKGLEIIYDEMKQLNVSTNQFIDLGSGTGRILHYAIIAGFDNAIGVELAEERHKYSQDVLNKVDPDTQKRIKIFNEDLFNIPKEFYTSCRVVLISNLLYSKETNQKLFDYLDKNLQSGTIVLVCIVPDDTKSIKKIKNIKIPVSWTQSSNLYIYQKE